MFDGTYVYVPSTCVYNEPTLGTCGDGVRNILIQRDIGISGIYYIILNKTMVGIYYNFIIQATVMNPAKPFYDGWCLAYSFPEEHRGFSFEILFGSSLIPPPSKTGGAQPLPRSKIKYQQTTEKHEKRYYNNIRWYA